MGLGAEKGGVPSRREFWKCTGGFKCLESQGLGVPAVLSKGFPGKTLRVQKFPRVTSIGSLPPEPSENPADPRRDPAEPSERPRRALGETPAEPFERQISSESLAEGCAPRMVTLWNFRRERFRRLSGIFLEFPPESASRTGGEAYKLHSAVSQRVIASDPQKSLLVLEREKYSPFANSYLPITFFYYRIN